MKDSLAQLAHQIGDMLAESPLDPKLKKLILDHLDMMPEDLVFKLKDMLEKEDSALNSFRVELESYLADQESSELRLEEEQRQAATKITDEIFDKLKDQI